jgi:hypothetical protein
MTESHPALPVLGRGRPGRTPKNLRNKAALGKGQCAIKTARPGGFGASCPPARSGTKSGKKAANLKEMGRGNFARHTRHLGNFMRGSLCVDVADRKGQAGLAEFWKPLRDRRDLRERRYCAFPRLRLASFNGVSALILNGKKSQIQ